MSGMVVIRKNNLSFEKHDLTFQNGNMFQLCTLVNEFTVD